MVGAACAKHSERNKCQKTGIAIGIWPTSPQQCLGWSKDLEVG